MRGVDRERHQNREDLLGEDFVHSFAIVISQIAPGFDVDIGFIECRFDEVLKRASVTLLKLMCFHRYVIEHLLGESARIGGNRDASRDSPLQSRHTHHEELIEVARKYREKVHSLEQWRRLIFGEL